MTSHLDPWTDPALEARVVAHVLGESSSFEAAEITRLLAEVPELAAFARRITAVHGLLGEASRPESSQSWQLSPERRQLVLKTLGTATAATQAKRSAQPAAKNRRFWSAGRLAIAAAIAFGLFVVGISLTFHLGGDVAHMSSIEPPGINGKYKELQTEVPQELSVGTPRDLSGALAAHEDSRRDLLAARNAPGSGKLEGDEIGMDALGVGTASEITNEMDATPTRESARTFAGVTESTAREPSKPTSSASSLSVHRESDLADASASVPGVSGLPVLGRLSKNGPVEETGDVSSASSDASVVREFIAPTEYEPPQLPNAPQGEITAFPVTPATPTDFSDGGADGARFAGSGKGSGGRGKDSNTRGRDVVGTEDQKSAEAGEFAKDMRGWENADPFSGEMQDADKKPDVPISRRQVESSEGKAVIVSGVETEIQAGAKAKPRVLMPPATMEASDAAIDPVSTFSLHVSNASFRLAARALLSDGAPPPPESIRPEDFVNAMDYGDAMPSRGESVAAVIQQSSQPFLAGRNLLRVGLRTGASGRPQGQPLSLTILLDQSGSMERPDRAEMIARTMRELATLLQQDDVVTVIGFSRAPRLIADRLPGARAGELPGLVRQAPPQGGTNLDAALGLAGEAAMRQFVPQAQNRIVLLTDGAANLGEIDPGTLMARVEGLRRQGIAFDACGVGTGGVDDTMLEALTRKGDGRYLLLDGDNDPSLAGELAGAFRPAAKNVKVQVRFNPDRVGKFHLIGFDNHRLQEKDFRDDTVDAAELAAAEQGNALYQVELRADGQGDIGEVSVRFLETATGRMVERHWTIPHDPRVPALDQAAPSMQLAATAGLLAEHLRGSPLGQLVRPAELTTVQANLRRHFPGDQRVATLLAMLDRVRNP